MRSALATLHATAVFQTAATRNSALTSGSCGCGCSGSQKKTRRSISPSAIRAPICLSPHRPDHSTAGSPDGGARTSASSPSAQSAQGRCSLSGVALNAAPQQVGLLVVMSNEGNAPSPKNDGVDSIVVSVFTSAEWPGQVVVWLRQDTTRVSRTPRRPTALEQGPCQHVDRRTGRPVGEGAAEANRGRDAVPRGSAGAGRGPGGGRGRRLVPWRTRRSAGPRPMHGGQPAPTSRGPPARVAIPHPLGPWGCVSSGGSDAGAAVDRSHAVEPAAAGTLSGVGSLHVWHAAR